MLSLDPREIPQAVLEIHPELRGNVQQLLLPLAHPGEDLLLGNVLVTGLNISYSVHTPIYEKKLTRYFELKGYTTLHEECTIYKRQHFTPTGPVFAAFPANVLAFRNSACKHAVYSTARSRHGIPLL